MIESFHCQYNAGLPAFSTKNFYREISSYFRAIADIISTDDMIEEFQMQTCYGELTINLFLFSDSPEVMCRWSKDATPKATKAFNYPRSYQAVNPCSGKWNHHFEDDLDLIQEGIEALKATFEGLKT